MTYEERMNAIGTLLRTKILARKQRPERFDDETARAEIADMVSDLNAAWPSMPPDMFEQTGDNLARELRAMHAGRDWPVIATMLKALKAATTTRRPMPHSTEEEPPVVYEGVKAWWQRHGDRCPFAREHHSGRLVADGLATWGQLRRAGFWIPDERRDEAMDEPDPNQEAIIAASMVIGARLRANFEGQGDVRMVRAAE